MAYQIFTHSNGDIYVEYSVSQDVVNNRSTISVTAIYFRSHNWYGVNFYGEGGLYINGTQVVAFNNSITYSCRVDSRDTWVLVSNSAGSQSITVNHAADGTGGFYMYPHGRSGSGYNDFNMFCLGHSAGNADYNENRYVALPTIDRTAPTVSLSASAASTTSATITATASVACDYWWYRVDSGSWTAFTPSNNSYTITGLSSGTHSIEVAARKTSNQVIGYSSAVSVDLAAPSITASVTNIGSSGFTISATSNVTCNIWDYSLDNGSTWTRIGTTEGTSTSVSVTGLNPNQTYNVKVRARKKVNNIYGTSSAVSVTTLGGSILHSAYNFAADDDTVKVKINVTIYGTFYHKLYFKDTNGTQIAVVTFQGTARTASDLTLSLSATTRTRLLAAMPTVKNMQVDLTLETYTDNTYATLVGSSGPKRCTMTTSAANSAPSFTDFTYQDTETVVTAITQNDQILLQSFSHLVVNAVAGTALNGSTITGYSVSIGDVSIDGTSTTLDVGAVSSFGNLTLRVTCSDSRGYYTSVDKTVTVLAYASPQLSSFTLRRQNEIGKLIQLMFSGSVSTIPISDVEKNALVSVVLKYKQTSASSWTTLNLTSALTRNGLFFSYSNIELMELDETQSYDFVLVVTDNLGTLSQLEYAVILNQGTPLLAFRKRSTTNNRPRVGLNNPTPVYELDVHGDIAMHDVIVQGFVAELGEEYLNNLQTGGYYVQSDSGEAITTRNYPAAKIGLLEVLASPSGVVVQRYTPFDVSAVYMRYYDGSGWTSWRAI